MELDPEPTSPWGPAGPPSAARPPATEPGPLPPGTTVGPLPDGSGFAVDDVEVGPCAECERARRVAVLVGFGVGFGAGALGLWILTRGR